MIDRTLAVEIARKRAAEKEWPFAEPVEVTVHRRWYGRVDRYEIWTPGSTPGTKACFVIQASTGAILDENPRAVIDSELAVAIARKRAAEKGWGGMADPLYVIARGRRAGGIDSYEIATNPAMLGTRARFVIDAATGAIREEGYIPR